MLGFVASCLPYLAVVVLLAGIAAILTRHARAVLAFRLFELLLAVALIVTAMEASYRFLSSAIISGVELAGGIALLVHSVSASFLGEAPPR